MGYRTSIEKAALKTLEQLGYTWHESELWKPPIGKSASPLLDKIDLLEARIAELTKDAERLKCFNQIWRWKALKDGEIIYQYGEHVPALFQKTAELLPTHPPAPDYTDLLKMIAHRARSFPNFPLGHHITEVFAAIGEEPPEPAPAPAPELKPLSLDEIHQRYKNLRGNEPPHYIDIYRDAETALGILRGGL